MTILAPTLIQNPFPRNMEFYNLVEGFLLYIIMNLVFLIDEWEWIRNFLKVK